MPAVVGHWNTLEEAQKLTQSQLVRGVIEEKVYRENPLDRMPVALALGKTIKWNREAYDLYEDVVNVDIGEQMNWSSSVTYDQQEATLKRKALPRVLDDFIVDVYGTINNYENTALWELKKAMYVALGFATIYDDTTYGGAKQFDGLHALAALEYTATAANQALDIDNGETGLSLGNLRKMIRSMKHGCDVIIVPPVIGDYIDQAYEERGFPTLAFGTMTALTRSFDQLGTPLMRFNGIPVVRSDYLVAENANTGRGSDLRAKHSTGTANYSIFGIKFGDVFAGQSGLCMAFGNPEMKSKLYKVDYFANLEDYDAAGIRLITYTCPLLGSSLALGRIHDVTADSVTA